MTPRRWSRRSLLAATGAVPLLAACSTTAPGPEAPDEDGADVATERVTYGDHPDQYGELTLPAGDPRGLVVVVHGGFWKPQYGIEYAQPLVPSLVADGWATWAIEYRRSGAADTLPDVRAAVDRVAGLPVDLPGDPATVVGLGHSAGGHLVTWAAAGGGFTHVVSQAGVLDLRAAYDAGLGGGAVEAFLGHPPGPADGDTDPVRMVPLDVPVWCVHGTADDVVPISQSRSYVAAATDAGATAELVEVDGDHFALVDPSTDAWSAQLELLRSL